MPPFVAYHRADGATHERHVDELRTAGFRPVTLNVSGDPADARYAAVWVRRSGPEWEAVQGLSAGEYQERLDELASQGFAPTVVTATGAAGGEIFAADDTPTPRHWNVTGADFAAAAALDEAVRGFMVRHAIRAGTVAVGRNADIIGSRGYTWAEPDYAVTQPGTRLRIASLSKIFTVAELGRLVAARRLSWDTRAFEFAGITSALPSGTPATPGMDAITVGQLVLRTSHLPRDFDQEQRAIAAALGVQSAPIPRELLLRYLYGCPLVDSIPAGGLYSNVAFYLLTSVVEQAAGLPFVAALQRDVLPELDIHDVAVATTAVDVRQPDEVPTYDHADVHASQLDYAPNALAPNAYGGDFVLETCAGSGGLLTSAPTIAKLIARHPVRNADAQHLTGREVGTRFGIWDGTSSGATSREDGLDFAFLFNRRVTDAERAEIRDVIQTVLDTHHAALY